jgi:hypothetical protein
VSRLLCLCVSSRFYECLAVLLNVVVLVCLGKVFVLVWGCTSSLLRFPVHGRSFVRVVVCCSMLLWWCV